MNEVSPNMDALESKTINIADLYMYPSPHSNTLRRITTESYGFSSAPLECRPARDEEEEECAI